MTQVSIWWQQWKSVAESLVSGFLHYLPNLIGALFVLLIGWGIARLGRAMVSKFAATLNRLLAGRLTSNRWIHLRLSQSATSIIGDIIFWLLMLVALTAAARTAKVDFFAIWLDRMLGYLPGILAGLLIAFVGYLASLIIRDIVSVAFSGSGVEQSRFLGLAAQTFVVILAVIVGLEQAGIDVAFLTTILGIVVGAVAAAFSLAFGFGARDFVSNLIGAYHLQRVIRPGQQVRIGDIEGEVLELTSTGVVLATAGGRVMAPGKVYNEHAISLLIPEHSDD